MCNWWQAKSSRWKKSENNNSKIGDNLAGELTAAKFFEAIEAETRKLPEVERTASMMVQSSR